MAIFGPLSTRVRFVSAVVFGFMSATLRACTTLISHTGAGAPGSIAAPGKSTVTFYPVMLSGVSARNVRSPTVMGAGPEVAISALNHESPACPSVAQHAHP
jgi:hypothetical protein